MVKYILWQKVLPLPERTEWLLFVSLQDSLFYIMAIIDC